MQLEKMTLAKASVLAMLIGVLSLFFFMIKGFLMALILSAIFSGVMYGIYERLTRRLNGRKSAASLLTILIFVLVVVLPMAVFTVALVDQALDAGENLIPAIEERLAHPDSFAKELDQFGLVHQIFPDQEKLIATLDKAVKALGGFVATGLSHITTGAARFLFEAFIFLFAMYYFLLYGKHYINKLLYYLPLKTAQERLLLGKFVTVTKSTLKGTLVIGVVQGGLGAIAMAIAGLDNTLFWGVVMAVLSMIPAIGPAVVWLPAGIFLLVTGHVPQGVGLLLFGGIVIGNIDNLIRPRLMGRDTKLPDLMILISTLGGLALFGMAGIIIGPIVGALLLTMLEIYGETFKDQLQPVELLEEDNLMKKPQKQIGSVGK